MKIALAQLNYTIGDIDGNTSKIIDSINKAKAQRADLVIFAEQAVSGTPAFDLLRKTTFLELCEDALVEIASCCDGIAAIVGLPILTADGTISAACGDVFLADIAQHLAVLNQRRGADPGSQSAALRG